MTCAFFSRLLLLSLSAAVAAVTVSGQNPAKKEPAKKAPAKPASSAAGAQLSDLPTIKFEKYTLPNGLVVILSRTIACRWFPRTSGTT